MAPVFPDARSEIGLVDGRVQHARSERREGGAPGIRAIGRAVSDFRSWPCVTSKEIKKVDPRTGHTEIHFYGQESFVKQMMRPGRRVLSFSTDRGRFDASGRALR
jgi:hypothetical protein